MKLPILDFDIWNDSRKDFQKVLQLMSNIKAFNAPKERHWQHHSLQISSHLITTGIFPVVTKKKSYELCEIELDPIENMIFVSTNDDSEEIPLDGESQLELYEQIEEVFGDFGILLNKQVSKVLSRREVEYDLDTLADFWKAIQIADSLLRVNRAEFIRKEYSQINIWSDSFDIAMLSFNGKTVKGITENELDKYYEYIKFGFSAGDDKIGKPYFYATPYPFQDEFLDTKLDNEAIWNNDDWKGAFISYDSLQENENQSQIILNLWNQVSKLINNNE